jgi:hypothetical protein
MINPINSALNATYTRQTAQADGPRVERRTPHAPGRAPGSSMADAPARETQASGLNETITPAEREMIHERFPNSKRMTQRLYGPARPATQMPASLGSLIDIKG